MGHGHEQYPKYVGQNPEWAKLRTTLHPPQCTEQFKLFEDCVAEKKAQVHCIHLIKEYNYCMRKKEPFWFV